jgi:hypothetical protein
MGSTVTCPHCGAENPKSLLVTMCHQCKRDMARPPTAPPQAAPSPRAAPSVLTAPPAHAPETPPPPQPPHAPSASRPSTTLPSAAGVEADLRHCPRCGFLSPASADRCERCRTPFDQAVPQNLGWRRCERCGHLQPDNRRSCEHCGLHFVGAQYAGPNVLHPVPTARVPRSREEQASATGCGIAFFGIFAFLLGLWILLAVTR